MITALKLIGLAVVGGIVLLVGGALLLLWIARRWFRRALAADRLIPCRVTLEPEVNPQWRSAGVATGFINELRALGFQDVGSFQVPELGGLLIHALYHPQDPAYAVVYDHQKVDPTMDISREFADGTSVTATNTTMGETLDRRPGTSGHWLGKVPARQLFEAIKTHPTNVAIASHSSTDFVAHFQKAYAESMNWRLKKGGVSRDEIRGQAEQNGQTLTDEQLTEVWEAEREKYRRQLQEGCIAQHLDDNKMPAAEWEKICDRAVALPETLELKEIVETLDTALTLDAEQRHQLEKLPASFGENGIDIAQKIVAENIAGLGLIKLGEVTEPVRAWIVLATDREQQYPAAKAA
jgi:hypothetical protein